ncbi:immunoglobulin superfamily member 1-like [Hemicordylus capensis]|uniref:immunoglobulin superfamily member 1-like n=1 Tax=Hemicordylus capensis TaxID=884348 RepID=UPI0023029A6C|nr:immunoglobulin superfamily member 1-like [Hemicordylus capensis]
MSTQAAMGLSFNILFLGWWLTGQWWTCRGQFHAEPFISVTPSVVVAVGGNVSIHCRSEFHNVTFALVKEEGASIKELGRKDAEKNGVIFHIINARPKDGGTYQCTYCLKLYHCQQWSPYSNHVHINITDPKLTRPTISKSPTGSVALGGQVKIHCEIQGGPAKFYLHKDGDPAAKWPMENDRNVGEFFISNVNWEHQGNYTCSYALTTRPSGFLVHSDPLELLVSDTDRSRDIITWVGCAVGLLVLVLLLLFLLFILNRKRRKSSTASERTQHLPMKETDMTQEVEDDTEGIAYATLNHYSSKTKQTANPDTLPESCVYAAVANNSTRKDQ